ncbi:MAG: hypothetical protein WC544_03635 [Patescibacteria group bacterium]
MPSGNAESPETNDFDIQRRKRVFGGLAVFIVLVLAFSVWQTGRQLKRPFQKEQTNSAVAAANTAQTPTNQVSASTLESLRSKDTDQDGITDYDELYVYHTSPYLSDSDSDGISDKAEIDQGADPNCPTGQACSRETTNTNASSLANANAQTDLTNGLLDTGQNLSADQLRSILRDSGVSESDLSQVDDASLLDLYQQTLAEQEGTTTDTNTAGTNDVTLNVNAADQTVSYDDLKNLSITDIRYLLVQSGVPQDSLDQVDDDTLRQIYLDSLEQNAQTTGVTNTNS